MKRDTYREKAFLKRYGKTVEINVDHCVVDNILLSYTVLIKGDKDYKITEYLKDGNTDYVDVEFDNKIHRYDRYLDAEIMVVDKMAGE